MQRVGVVGHGLMGVGIAEVCARARLQVVVVENTETAAATGFARIERSLRRRSTQRSCSALPFYRALALADLIGLDTTTVVNESLYEELKEPLYTAPP